MRFDTSYNQVVFTLTFVVLLFTNSAGADTLSEQLLDSYFATAGVCTSSKVQSIIDINGIVAIELDIEPSTKLALQKMEPSARDDWFSLHCPPEIHGVWRQQAPPDDIVIHSPLSATISHQLSCSQYQQRDRKRKMSIQDTIRAKISKLLNGQ